MKHREEQPSAVESINSVSAVKGILTSKIFVLKGAKSYVFSEDAFAILDGDLSMLIRRNYISWTDVGAKYKYSLHQKDGNLIFTTFHNEIAAVENEFTILIEQLNGAYIISFLSLRDKTEALKLVSD